MAEGTLVKLLITPHTYRKLKALQQALGADSIAETIDILYRLLLDGRLRAGPSRPLTPVEPRRPGDL